MEAIKKAVEVRLGAAFMSRAVVEKEVKLGLLAVLHIEVRPGRWFDILPFASSDTDS